MESAKGGWLTRMRRLIDYIVWRFGSGGRGPLAYRMLADALSQDVRARS